MKKTLVLLAGLVPMLASAQTTYKFYYGLREKKIVKYEYTPSGGSIITVDPVTDDLKDLTFAKGDKVQVVIPDINTYAYSISIQIENQSFNTQPPKLLASLFTDFDPSAIVSAAAAAKAVPKDDKKEPFKYSKKLSNLIAQVVTKRKNFYYKSLALTDRNLSDQSPNQLKAVKTQDEASLLSDFKDATDEIDKVQPAYLSYSVADDIEKDDKALLDAIYKAFSDKDYQGIFETYMAQLINVTADDFKFETPEVKVTGEKVNITVNITPVIDDKLKNAAVAATTTRTYGMLTKNLWHWSFSGGFFTSGLVSKTYIPKPSTQINNSLKVPADTITGYKNVLDNNPDVVLGANVLVHYTYKFTPGFEMGGHFGVGVPINSKTNMNYLAGLTFMFFNDNRLGINIGGAGGYIQQLSPNVSTDTFYRKSGDLPISYVDKLALRWQFSITYNLSDLFAAKPAAATAATSDASKTAAK